MTKIGTSVTYFSDTLLEKIGSAGVQLQQLFDQYHAARDAGRTQEAQQVDQQINAIVDGINLYKNSKPQDLGLSDDIDTLEEFLRQEAAQAYRQKARKILLEGNYVPQFLFAGAATRLKRGPMYGLDIWDVAAALNKASIEEARSHIGMGPRQILAYRLALEKLARVEKDSDFRRNDSKGLARNDSEGLAMTPKEVLDKQRMIVNINEEIEKMILDDFRQNNFYEFSPEHVYFIIQPIFCGFKLKDGKPQLDHQSPKIPYGHGHNFMQLAETRQAFTLGPDGRKHELTSGSMLDQLADNVLIGSHRINDLTRLSYDSVISIDKLAYAMAKIEKGFAVVGELVNNPYSQKGGNVLKDKKTDRSFLIETSNVKGDSRLAALLDEAGKKGAPYNAFRLIYHTGRLKNILEKPLPFNLRFKDGYFYLEAVTGDVTQMAQTKAQFMSSGEVIHDFKEPKNIDEALDYVRQSDRQLAAAGLSPAPPRRGFASLRMTWTEIKGDIDRWLPLAQKVSLSDINVDMFRDYDYRYVKEGVALKPEIVFILSLVWAKMALQKAIATGIKTRDVLVARDARKIEPDLVDSQIAALRYAGLNVVFVGDTPNCVTSYSWAVQSREWLMTIFNTASHVAQPENIIVRGFKVTQLRNPDSHVSSLTTKEIKEQSLAEVKAFIADKTNFNKLATPEFGQLRRETIEKDTVGFNTALGLVAGGKKSIYNFSQDLKCRNAKEVVGGILTSIHEKPLAGLKIVVEGSHTPSGPIACAVFENLGACVVGLNQDVHEISGLHNADPSIEKNLEDLKKKIMEARADFGIAFDLDGDRGAILIPQWDQEDKTVEEFHVLAPDNIMGILLGFFLNDWGYAASGKKIGVIRDCLGTYGVNEMARQNGVEAFQTDAGYVYLKALREKLEAQGYVFPIYGERSGHTWVFPEIENPVAVAVLFSIVAVNARGKDFSRNSILDFYRRSTIPYSQSPRFQPFYHPQLLQWLSDHNDQGWRYVPGNNPPQAIVALGKDEAIKRLRQRFSAGAEFDGYKVSAFNTYQDPPDEGGILRYADIMFEKDGRFVGRVVVRASSNDPTFVMSYEAKIIDGKVQKAKHDRMMIAGPVMKFMIDDSLAIFTRDQMRQLMGLKTEDLEKQFGKANLGPVEDDFKAYGVRCESQSM